MAQASGRVETRIAEAAPTPILFTHYGDSWIRGSEQLLLDLLAHLDPARFRPIVWCNATEMADATRALGFITYRSDFRIFFDYQCPRFSLDRYWALMREGRDLVRRHKIRVLHSNSAGPCQWLAPIARIQRLPLLVHLHTPYLRRSRYVFLVHQASLVVGVSRPVIDPLIADGLPAAKAKVIHNGVDFSRLRQKTIGNVRSQFSIPIDAMVISTTGSLIWRKGHDLLLRAFSLLDPARNSYLLIVGDGPERANLEKLAQELGVQARVQFLGDSKDVGAIYAASDVVALASRMESFGLVLAEAGYCELPVVATAVGGIPEVIENGVTGLLVPPEDPHALAGALVRLIDDPGYRKRLGHAGKKRVEMLFSAQRMVEEFQQAYLHLGRVPRRQLGWMSVGATLKPYLNLVARLDERGSNAQTVS